jgi:aminomuconate-semialdehyde/2-hydroxymuconate-6-semialdehyde dehydrogenase
VKRFVEKANQIVVGDPKAKTTNMGALISKEHLAKVTSYIDMARKEGAKIECGGERPADLPEELSGGYWLRPTVITGLNHDSCVLQDEIFGPVVTITTFKTEDEAIEQANCVKYGLACSIWTENSGRTHRVALAVHAGTVWVNTWLLRDLRVPFGGMKASGIGREGGEHSIDSYTELKTVCIRYDM